MFVNTIVIIDDPPPKKKKKQNKKAKQNGDISSRSLGTEWRQVFLFGFIFNLGRFDDG